MAEGVDVCLCTDSRYTQGSVNANIFTCLLLFQTIDHSITMFTSPVAILFLLYGALTAAGSPVTTSSEVGSQHLWPEHVSAR